MRVSSLVRLLLAAAMACPVACAAAAAKPPAAAAAAAAATPATDSPKKPGGLGPAAAKALAGLDLDGRVGQMLHLSVKKVRTAAFWGGTPACLPLSLPSSHPPTPSHPLQVLYNYPDDPYVEKQKVVDWLTQVKLGTITNTPFDGQKVRCGDGWG